MSNRTINDIIAAYDKAVTKHPDSTWPGGDELLVRGLVVEEMGEVVGACNDLIHGHPKGCVEAVRNEVIDVIVVQMRACGGIDHCINLVRQSMMVSELHFPHTPPKSYARFVLQETLVAIRHYDARNHHIIGAGGMAEYPFARFLGMYDAFKPSWDAQAT